MGHPGSSTNQSVDGHRHHKVLPKANTVGPTPQLGLWFSDGTW